MNPKPTFEDLMNLIVKVAVGIAHDHGPDGNAYGFTEENYPEGAMGYGDTKEEAAVEYLKDKFE